MNYADALNYLYSTLPMFQRVGAAAYKRNLDNAVALSNTLDNPQRKFKSVHVAGTNGKGSSSHLLAAILQSAGYKTGLYTSPHMKEFTERIRVNGAEVSHEFVVSFVERMKPHLAAISPSFFETTVAMAFDYFASEKVDIAVVEVGLGGRLDSTNIITPVVSLITNISFDHKDLLGDTLPEIAAEKGGIIKPDVPAVVSQRQPGIDEVFIRKAEEAGTSLVFASDHYELNDAAPGTYRVTRDGKEVLNNLNCGLKGVYQRKNIPGVLCTVEALRQNGFVLTETAVREGMLRVVELTGLRGRWQKLDDRPLTICDVGHNEDGIRDVVRQLKTMHYGTLYFIFGMVKDKDITSVLALLPKEAAYLFCQSKIPRAMPASELAAQSARFGLKGQVVEDVNEALRTARAQASADDVIFVGGSTFVVGEIDNL